MHRPYYRAPASLRPSALEPKRPRKPRAPRQSAPFPLTALAELLGCHAASAYRGVKKHGMRLWVQASLRERLTLGANYAVGLELRRTIRFNAAVLERDARFRLGTRAGHQSKRLDGHALAQALEVPADDDFLTVWLWHLNELTDTLVLAVEEGHLEDLPWFKAQRYIDRAVVPRVRMLTHVDPTAAAPHPNRFGGLKRVRLLLRAVASNSDLDQEWLQVDWARAALLYPELADYVPEIDALDDVEAYISGPTEAWRSMHI